MKRMTAFWCSIILAACWIALTAGCGSGDSEKAKKADGASAQASSDAKSGAAEAAAPGNANQPQREISFMTMQLNPPFGDFFKGLFKEFEEAHPGVKIKWIDQPYQGYETKLMTSLMGGKGPDVINFASETVAKYATSGRLAEIEPLLSADTLSGYLPQILESGCKVEGKTYALPWYMSMDIVLYNKELFAKAGIDLKEPIQNIDDVPSLCKTMQDKTGQFAFFPLYTEAGSFKWYFLEAGVPLLDESGRKAAFNTPRGVEILKFWTDLYKNKLVPSEALTAMHRRPTELFNSGRLAMLASGAEFIRNVKADAPDLYKSLMVGPRLQWKGRSFQTVALHVLAINKSSENRALAAEFAAFITNAKNQVDFCKKATIFPSAAKGLDDPFFTMADESPEGRIRKICAEKARNAFVLNMPVEASKLYPVFNEIAEKVCLGKMTPEEALKFAEKRWNEILGH